MPKQNNDLGMILSTALCIIGYECEKDKQEFVSDIVASTALGLMAATVGQGMTLKEVGRNITEIMKKYGRANNWKDDAIIDNETGKINPAMFALAAVRLLGLENSHYVDIYIQIGAVKLANKLRGENDAQ